MSSSTGKKRTKTGQFSKGQSGNPNGRPRKEASVPGSVFDVLLDREVNGILEGNTTALSVEEALQQQTLKNAFAGKRSAQRQVLKMIEKREAYFAEQTGGQPPPKYDFAFETDPDNANDALCILDIAREHPGGNGPDDPKHHLLLEPWAVQTALSRRRGGSKLTKHEIEDIKRSTRDADRLRWPRGTGA